jgi:DNA invertase Pin-like site-specific DNA recombinase
MINLNLDLSDPLGMAMFHVVMAFAQLERGMISKRTKDALAWKRGQGLPTGRRAPIGWRKEGVEKDAILVPDPKSRARAYLIVELRDRHRLPWEAIPSQLQSIGVLGETEHYRRKDATGKMTVQTAIKAYRVAKAGFPLPNGERRHAFDWEPELWTHWGIAYDRDQNAA